MIRVEFLYLFQRNFIIAIRSDIDAQFAEVLDQVIGKGIVIVYHQQHDIHLAFVCGKADGSCLYRQRQTVFQKYR